jgi:hypothetical protein
MRVVAGLQTTKVGASRARYRKALTTLQPTVGDRVIYRRPEGRQSLSGCRGRAPQGIEHTDERRDDQVGGVGGHQFSARLLGYHGRAP